MLLTTGLAGGLLATSIAGITLSSCTFQVQQDPNNNNNNNNQGNGNSTNQGTTTTNPKDELTYNPNANYYTTQIIFDAHGNITNASANTLTISDTGLIFADPAMTTLIGIMPSVQTSQITIPASVKAITGYQAAVVYDTTSGKIVNPDFNPGTGLVLATNQAILDLGSVGAFQHVGAITDGTDANTPPSMSAATGLSTLTTLNFANNSQLQTIGPKAFLGCNNLTTVNLPNSTNTIGAQAFQNCTNLQTINLKGVSYIGDAAFNNAFIAQNSALATQNPVTLDLTSAQYIGTGAFDSSVWNKNTTTTKAAAAASDPVQVLPGTTSTEPTTTITQTQNLSKISAISFAKPLTTLKPYAFNGANYLTAADLSNCTSLAEVSNNAFSGTQNLTSVKFSNTIDTIGNNAFSGAPLKETLTFNTNTDLTIGANAFNSQALTTIDFSQVNGNITIGQSAFSNLNADNTSLTTLTLPVPPTDGNFKNIVMIGENAFNNCSKLTLPGLTDANANNYSLPANIGYVGPNAFSATTLGSLKSGFTYTPTFTVTDDWSDVANGLFAGMANGSAYFGPLTANDNPNLTSIDLLGTKIQALNYGDLSELGLSGSTTSGTSSTPYTGTFANASKLKTITLPASCNQFGVKDWTLKNTPSTSGTFANCTSLQNLNFKNFALKTTTSTDGNGNQTVTTDNTFTGITQQTWLQVANIMNAMAYLGQQKIVANSDVEGGLINDQATINKITYTVNHDPLAANGTWLVNGATDFGQSQNAQWTAQFRNNFNWPISAYPAGSYGYSVKAADAGAQSKADEEATPVATTLVNYPAGLGTSVSANFKDSGGAASLSTTMNGTTDAAATAFGQGVLLNGQVPASSSNGTDANVIFNTKVTNADSIKAQSTITITNGTNDQAPTRPQSVWYTVSASGKTATDSGGESITQAGYTLTPDETNNIFAISPNQIAGYKGTAANANPDQGYTGSGYSTAVGGWKCQITNQATPVDVPSANGLKTDNGSSGTTDITLSQNYLPLGITSTVKDAYFNHNGVIWHYHNGLVAGDNTGIFIQGYVNAYIGGSIQPQNNGVGALSSGNKGDLPPTNYLTAGIYSDSNFNTGLTSVGSATKLEMPSTDSVGKAAQGISNYPTAAIGLFGGKTGTGDYSDSNAPADITVTLTLVPGNK